MPRINTFTICCVTFSMLVLVGVIINKSVRNSIEIWMNTPFDPVRARWQNSRRLIRGQSAKIHAAMLLYAAHNRSRLPPMNSAEQTRVALLSYTGDLTLLVNPVTHHLFQPNAFLSHHKMRDIVHPSQVIAFYDIHSPDPGYDKNQLLSYPEVDMLFLDGTFSTVPSYDWPEYRLASKIPASPKQEKRGAMLKMPGR